ncbi:Na+/H+ antiporter NhaA [Nocardia sp. NPDC020380]|uniref:Na+/H+ antiporter NhaA n=1 Tax=Nocardia sp. NPDC020380 TaxID=3364309 RepID=UPI00378EB076
MRWRGGVCRWRPIRPSQSGCWHCWRVRAPAGLRALLLAIATVDDVLAVVVIAVGYAGKLRWGWLALAVAGCGLVVVLRRLGVLAFWPYLLVGALVWWATLHSGVHATIAGVALALLTPAAPMAGRPVLPDLLCVVAPLSAFVAVPLFVLANAAVPLGLSALSDAAHARVTWAVVIALVLGKFIGVVATIGLTVAAGAGRLPPGIGPRQVTGLGWIAGLGFTVALFVTELAYTRPQLVEHAKIGVLVASVLAATAAAITLAATDRPTDVVVSRRGACLRPWRRCGR